jgi:hypothetical protein
MDIASTGPCVGTEMVFIAPRSDLRLVSEKSPSASTLLQPFAINPSAFSHTIAKSNAGPLGTVFSPGAVLVSSSFAPLRI